MTTSSTKETILGIARARVQALGYNALSFREIAKEVGIKSASIHHHFPTKGDLGAALARRYTEDGVKYLTGLSEQSQDPRFLINGYTAIFRSALVNDNRMCLCGIMAAEYQDLPLEVRTEVDAFTEANVNWLVTVLCLQQGDAPLKTLQQKALAIYSAVEGAQLVSRGRNDIAAFDETVEVYRAAGLLP
ncbi:MULTISPECIES: TetR/AcrR family transcriptional regulator [unclassified Pseudomonas]|uniref:TetR/AcrR family transcriptional regulator n=1 Tax=unclassified Pseudomonas TaxID=196821 RepID=UPI002AC91FDB|nr:MULTISPECIES: TetR/AcrR family transcriptional regulator [unclassified Pseudomonas]MEB0040757.1 TetR/AcrR family transcriptional regulator [Pseudomonas sp. MH10]MEB0122617.1 TetR/AcrR family transcriptional regulator [Pseudomonas sp. CCI1.2]WPX65016.1 TetR/AcrR family transcriptional regulator [Pseudomonas sp. MH10]